MDGFLQTKLKKRGGNKSDPCAEDLRDKEGRPGEGYENRCVAFCGEGEDPPGLYVHKAGGLRGKGRERKKKRGATKGFGAEEPKA